MTEVLRRPAAVTVLAILQLVGGALAFISVAVLLGLDGLRSDDGGVRGFLMVVCAITAGAGVLQVMCGLGLLKLKPYGRTLMLVFAWIGVLGFPIGTIISILILFYLHRPGIKLLFSGRPVSDLSPAEIAQVQAAGVGPVIAVLLVVLAVVIAGIAAAFAIPGLRSARFAGNEASAIGSLRAINSGQMAYAAACGNGGYAVTLDDLAKPPVGGSVPFVASDLGTNDVVKSGYRVRVEPIAGANAIASAAATCNGAASGSSSAYFATAEPVMPGETGGRYFATDSSGTIYESDDPIPHPIVPSVSVRPLQ
jgi:type IV pilus assembly protein PilA